MIASQFGKEGDYSKFTITATAVDAVNFAYGVTLDDTKTILLLGPFSEDTQLIEILIAVSNGTFSDKFSINLISPTQTEAT